MGSGAPIARGLKKLAGDFMELLSSGFQKGFDQAQDASLD
jgi:hypothetical protein